MRQTELLFHPLQEIVVPFHLFFVLYQSEDYSEIIHKSFQQDVSFNAKKKEIEERSAVSLGHTLVIFGSQTVSVRTHVLHTMQSFGLS